MPIVMWMGNCVHTNEIKIGLKNKNTHNIVCILSQHIFCRNHVCYVSETRIVHIGYLLSGHTSKTKCTGGKIGAHCIIRVSPCKRIDSCR